MNKHMSRAEIGAIAVSLAERLAALRQPASMPTEPFAKREEGRARRMERRNVRARKSAWLNS